MGIGARWSVKNRSSEERPFGALCSPLGRAEGSFVAMLLRTDILVGCLVNNFRDTPVFFVCAASTGVISPLFL
jgi:hypothetical protein